MTVEGTGHQTGSSHNTGGDVLDDGSVEIGHHHDVTAAVG